MKEIQKDQRFASVLKDPRFKKVPVQERKTKIDKRFKAMFKDKNYRLNYVMDKHGKPMGHTSSEDLKRLYNLASSESEDESDSACSDKDGQSSAPNVESTEMCDVKNAEKEHGNEVRHVSSDDEEHKSEFPEAKSSDESTSETDDSDSDSTTEEEESNLSVDEDNNDFDHKWDELDADAPVAEEVTKRLAVCNMDWDRIRAEDILSVFNSFKPSNGIIHSVKIYPSEFGLRRMEEEKLHGPLELVEKTVTDDDNKKNDTSKEGSRYHREKLRQYQISRLKYYYAVVECDSPDTANSLYEQLNGMEYESSAVCLDIRFIPDDVTFDQEPKSTASGVSCPSDYKPRLFINSALQQVKVNLTWDETDPKRRETLQKAFREPESIDKDIRDYLASSSGSDQEDCDDAIVDVRDKQNIKMKDRIANYRSLLQSLEEKEKEKDDENKYDMEITWEPGLKEKTKEVVKEKLSNANLNPFEEKLKKMKEEKKQRIKEKKCLKNEQVSASSEISSDDDDDDGRYDKLGQKHKESKSNSVEAENRNKMAGELALLMDGSGDELESKNMKKKWKQKKKKAKEEEADDFQVNIKDPRFSAIYTSHLYNIDPSDPHYRDTKGMQSIIQEKQRKRKRNDDSSAHEPSLKETRLSQDAIHLIESVKRKTGFKKKNK